MQVTGRGSNVNFTIDDRAPFAAVIAGVEECLVKNRHLFSRGSITVDVGRRILAREQLTQIKRILEAESGLTVAQFWCSPDILEETLPDIGPEQSPEVPDQLLDQNTPIQSPALPEYQPDPEILSTRLELAGSEEPDEAGDSSEQAFRWATPDFTAIPKPGFLIPPPAQKEMTVESQYEPLPREDSQDAETRGDSPAPAEPAGQASPESLGGLIPEASPEITTPSIAKEPSIEPLVEPSLLELAVMGLEQSIAAGTAFEGELELLSPEPHSGKAPSGEAVGEAVSEGAPSGDAGLSTHPPDGTGVASSTSTRRETGGLNRQNEALLIKTTCRSGEVVRYSGDVVILADVNPGAEIIADGDILVFGSLRGLAHAGAGGDTQATIIALNLESPRIQIGPYTGMAPKAQKRNKSNRPGPTLVFVRRQQIIAAPFKGRFAGYSGGIIYDG